MPKAIGMTNFTWPLAVWVATPEQFVFDGPPGATSYNLPQSMTGWLDYELREHLIEQFGNFDIYVYSKMYDTWMDHWHRIFPCYFHNCPMSKMSRKQMTNPKFPSRNVGQSQTKKGFSGYSRYDLYNATWASLGYVQDQSPRALQLLSLSKK